jgi:hypothetical protein
VHHVRSLTIAYPTADELRLGIEPKLPAHSPAVLAEAHVGGHLRRRLTSSSSPANPTPKAPPIAARERSDGGGDRLRPRRNLLRGLAGGGHGLSSITQDKPPSSVTLALQIYWLAKQNGPGPILT